MTIQEFSFGNFRSFKEIQTLNLAAAKIKSHDEAIDISNVIDNPSIQLLKSKAIYGANASGKSNIIKALVAFVRIVKSSVKDDNILSRVDSFKLSSETENQPSFFQLVFWHNGTRYRYGFELDDEGINAEWLYATPSKRELPLFIRERLSLIEVDKTNFYEGYRLDAFFKEGDGNEIFRDNSLFLSSIASLGLGKLSKELIDAIGSIFLINGLGSADMYWHASNSLNDSEKKKYMIDFLNYGDIGIEDLNTIDFSTNDESGATDNEEERDYEVGKRFIFSQRKKFDKNLNVINNEQFSFLLNESEGTRKLFEFSPVIYEALKNNRPIVIDEFDARFHPLLTKKIVELFNSKTNHSAQLIFTTHDTNLLSADLLRRDQIEFVEKDKYGASHLYSLAEFKGIRNNASFEKDYIQGKYGAIPFIGDFSKLINPDPNA